VNPAALDPQGPATGQTAAVGQESASGEKLTAEQAEYLAWVGGVWDSLDRRRRGIALLAIRQPEFIVSGG
jgi:hypothetical protein